MVNQYEIENITPFNDVYYSSCNVLTFFTAVRYLGGSIFSFIANGSFIYLPKKVNEFYSVVLHDIPQIPTDRLTEQNNIRIAHIQATEDLDIVETITEALLNEELIIVPVDGFYYRHPYHDLFYHTEYHPQTFLFYGFDCENETFKIIDINGFEWNNERCCYKHNIGFQDLRLGYQSILRHNKASTASYIQKLSKIDPDIIINDEPGQYKEQLLTNLISHRREIEAGISYIKFLSENISQFEISKTDCFNNKVTSFSNLYKMDKILGCQNSYLPILKNIHNKWKIIEHLVYKFEIRGVVIKEHFKLILEQVYTLENQLYSELFAEYN